MLSGAKWPEGLPLRVRIGLHTGETHERDADDPGPAVNRAARVMDVANGTQILVSAATREIVGGRAAWVDDGGRTWCPRPPRRERAGPPVSRGRPALSRATAARRGLGTSAPGTSRLDLGAARTVRRRGEVIEDLPPPCRHPHRRGWHRQDAVGAGGGPRHSPTERRCVVGRAQHHSYAGVACVDTAQPARRRRPPIAISTRSSRGSGSASVVDPGQLRAPTRRRGGVAPAIVVGVSGCAVLATSRGAVDVEGERARRAPPLAPTQRSRGIDVPVRAEQLGAAVDPFRDGEAIVQICHASTAFRSRSSSPPRGLDRCGRRRSPTGSMTCSGSSPAGGRASTERHRTLRATLEWSYEMLTPSEQPLLARSAIFSGSFSLAAAEAIAGASDRPEDEIVDVLDRLVARSLVVPVDDGEESRFRLLEPVRQLAARSWPRAVKATTSAGRTPTGTST